MKLVAPRNPRWLAYPQAKWRGMTRMDAQSGTAVLCFALASGETLRLHLSERELRNVAEVTRECVDSHRASMTAQSGSSSGKPQDDGSSPDPGQSVCPPTRSSSAEAGDA